MANRQQRAIARDRRSEVNDDQQRWPIGDPPNTFDINMQPRHHNLPDFWTVMHVKELIDINILIMKISEDSTLTTDFIFAHF